MLPGKRLYTRFKADQEMKKAEKAVVVRMLRCDIFNILLDLRDYQRAAEHYKKIDPNLDKCEEEDCDQVSRTVCLLNMYILTRVYYAVSQDQ